MVFSLLEFLRIWFGPARVMSRAWPYGVERIIADGNGVGCGFYRLILIRFLVILLTR